MNQAGRYISMTIWGESHGPAVGFTLDGCIPGIPLHVDDFKAELLRRQGGNQPGTTTRKETDEPVFLSGIFNGFSTGAPIAVMFQNQDTRRADYDAFKAIPRPGHADWVASQKFAGYQDYRGGGHFSGRLTVCLVAAGVIAKKMMDHMSAGQPVPQCEARLTEAGGIEDIEKAIQDAALAGDSIGGIVECRISRVPVGLGSPFFESLESQISQWVFSIPAIKAIEFGSGFQAARMTGSTHNDVYTDAHGSTITNHAGGISGGISNGNDIIFRVAVKPTSSTPKTQDTFNPNTERVEPVTIPGRHDLCLALRVPVVIESVCNLVLLDCMLEPAFREMTEKKRRS